MVATWEFMSPTATWLTCSKFTFFCRREFCATIVPKSFSGTVNTVPACLGDWSVVLEEFVGAGGVNDGKLNPGGNWAYAAVLSISPHAPDSASRFAHARTIPVVRCIVPPYRKSALAENASIACGRTRSANSGGPRLPNDAHPA